MADAQIQLRDGTTNIARGATQEEINDLLTPRPAELPFAKVGDFIFAADMLVSAYMLDEQHVEVDPAFGRELGHIYTEADLSQIAADTEGNEPQGQAGHRYTEADLAETPEGS